MVMWSQRERGRCSFYTFCWTSQTLIYMARVGPKRPTFLSNLHVALYNNTVHCYIFLGYLHYVQNKTFIIRICACILICMHPYMYFTCTHPLYKVYLCIQFRQCKLYFSASTIFIIICGWLKHFASLETIGFKNIFTAIL